MERCREYVDHLKGKLEADILAYRRENHYAVTIIVCHPDAFRVIGKSLAETGARIIRSLDVGSEEFLCKSER